MLWVRPPAAAQPERGELSVHGTWVTPGEELCEEVGFLRGHGTYVKDGMLVAAVAGLVERVNKLVSVRPYKARYAGEVGDVVVCRVAEVGAKRWKVDVNARQKGVLLLSSINLPGGEQRRRTAEDQLNMRQFYVEHDVLSAEVQTFFADGAMSLHTRSLKYGKLRTGALVTVAPSLVRRAKQHFHTFAFGVAVIFGMNGFVWVGPAAERETESGLPDEAPLGAAEPGASDGSDVPVEVRERICRVRNALVILDSLFLPVSATTVQALFELSEEAELSVWGMLLPDNVVALADKLRASGLLGHARGDDGDD
jgi:exosome complex component RRP4